VKNLERVEKIAATYNKLITPYDEWYKANKWIYDLEIECVKKALHLIKKETGYVNAIEFGIGTGRFASYLHNPEEKINLKFGMDISLEALKIAKKRGCIVWLADMNSVNFKPGIFNTFVFITSFCYLTKYEKANILKTLKLHSENTSSFIIVGTVPGETPLGQIYSQQRNYIEFFSHIEEFSTSEELINLFESQSAKFVKYWGFKIVDSDSSSSIKEEVNDFTVFLFKLE